MRGVLPQNPSQGSLVEDRYVAVGILTQPDLDRLGDGFRRFFPIVEGHDFDALLEAIDRAEEARPRTDAPRRG